MKTCLFGGSFDPVHAGHLTIAAAAQKQCGLDEVVFLPAACSPFKQGKNTFFSDAQRLQMLQLATEDFDAKNFYAFAYIFFRFLSRLRVDKLYKAHNALFLDIFGDLPVHS